MINGRIKMGNFITGRISLSAMKSIYFIVYNINQWNQLFINLSQQLEIMYTSKGNGYQIPKQQVQFSSDQLNQINAALSHRYKIEDTLNKFSYQDHKKYAQNVKNLSQTISNVLQLQTNLKKRFFSSFSDYISYEENVPIEINFKKLRYEQFCNLVAEWETSIKQPSIIRPSERLYSIQHRNILFSRVFVQQKQVIEEYFEELSQKKMLKGVDLYQLLADILSHYFLYEFLTDNQTFFQKVNSFNNFLEVVQKFINSQTRIIIDNKSKDFQYIKLYQFQALIYFWESINPELQIRSNKRFSACSKEVQTQCNQIMSIAQKGIQTVDSKDKVLTLDEIINNSMKSLNKLTEIESDPEKLEIIQNIFESLRKEKIKLTQYQKTKSTRRRSDTSRNMLHINSIDSRFLDVTSQQSDIELQKTERILKGYVSPDELRESASKRKSQNKISLDKTVGVNDKGLIKIRMPETENKKKSPEKLKHVEFHSFSSQNNDMLASSSSETKPIRILPNQEIEKFPIDRGTTFMAPKQEMRIKTQSSEKSGYSEYTKEEKKSETRSMLNLFEMIYNHYADKSSQVMDGNKLQKFFVDIGIIGPRESVFELKALRLSPIKNFQNIKQIQFLEIMGLIMKDDPDLTYEVISEFVDLYVKSSIVLKRIQPQFDNQKYNQSRNIASRSQILQKDTYGSSQLFNKDTYGKSEFRGKDTSKLSVLRDKETYKMGKDKSAQKIYPKYSDSIKELGAYSKVNGFSFEREKSKDISGRKKRYMYCQQPSQEVNESYLGKMGPFNNNNNFYR